MVKILVITDNDNEHDGGECEGDNINNCHDTCNVDENGIAIGIDEASNGDKVGAVIVDDSVDANDESHCIRC